MLCDYLIHCVDPSLDDSTHRISRQEVWCRLTAVRSFQTSSVRLVRHVIVSTGVVSASLYNHHGHLFVLKAACCRISACKLLQGEMNNGK
jgi:hypothetical protein